MVEWWQEGGSATRPSPGRGAIAPTKQEEIQGVPVGFHPLQPLLAGCGAHGALEQPAKPLPARRFPSLANGRGLWSFGADTWNGRVLLLESRIQHEGKKNQRATVVVRANIAAGSSGALRVTEPCQGGILATVRSPQPGSSPGNMEKGLFVPLCLLLPAGKASPDTFQAG